MAPRFPRPGVVLIRGPHALCSHSSLRASRDASFYYYYYYYYYYFYYYYYYYYYSISGQPVDGLVDQLKVEMRIARIAPKQHVDIIITIIIITITTQQHDSNCSKQPRGCTAAQFGLLRVRVASQRPSNVVGADFERRSDCLRPPRFAALAAGAIESNPEVCNRSPLIALAHQTSADDHFMYYPL